MGYAMCANFECARKAVIEQEPRAFVVEARAKALIDSRSLASLQHVLYV
jgi:hypothetical protein